LKQTKEKMNFQNQIISILSLSAVMLFSQCGSEPIRNGHIAKLQKEKDSLRQVKQNVSQKINDLEDQIKLLDTMGYHNVPVVTVTKVKTGIFKHYFVVQGVVESDKNATINSDVGAKILKIRIKEGDRVKKGQILMELDSRVLTNSIEELKNQIDLATIVYNKQKSLWDQKIGSEMQYLEAKTNKDGLERKLQTINSQLENYHIMAPFDGLVDEIFPKVGEMASPAMPLLRVMNLDQVYLKADVSEDYFGRIKVGDTAIIDFQSIGIELKSSITRIGNYINPNNRTFKIRFELDNKAQHLVPNMLAVVKVLDYTAGSKSIIIPSKLLQESPQGDEFVYIIHENGSSRAQKVMITTGKTYGGEVEVLSGLNTENEIIATGARNIKDGEVVGVHTN